MGRSSRSALAVAPGVAWLLLLLLLVLDTASGRPASPRDTVRSSAMHRLLEAGAAPASLPTASPAPASPAPASPAPASPAPASPAPASPAPASLQAPPSPEPEPAPASPAPAQSPVPQPAAGGNASSAEDSFDGAPSCRALPTAATSRPDSEGRLWGWRSNESCAFKDVAGHVLFYVDYVPSDWLRARACEAEPFPDSSVADSRYKVWGWEGGRLCAFKDDQQAPIPIDRNYYKLTWSEAPACTADPVPSQNNSAADSHGCLWGWQLDRNCAFKNETTSEPLSYDGHGAACNATIPAPDAQQSTGGESDGADVAFDLSEAQSQDLIDVQAVLLNASQPSAAAQPNASQPVLPVDSAAGAAAAAAAANGTVLPPVDLGTAPTANGTSSNGSIPAPAANDTAKATGGEEEDALSMPSIVTAVGAIGHKTEQPYYTAAEIADKFKAGSPAAGATGPPANASLALPDNTDAPFKTAGPGGAGSNSTAAGGGQAANVTVARQPAPVVASATATANASQQVLEKGAPAKQQAANDWGAAAEDVHPSDWTDGGPGGLAPPRHPSRSALASVPLLPESPRQPASFGAAESSVAPAAQANAVMRAQSHGPGGVSLPGTRGSNGRTTRLGDMNASGPFGIAESSAPPQLPQAAAASEGVAGPGHALDPLAPLAQRRLMVAVAEQDAPAAPLARPSRKLLLAHDRRLAAWLGGLGTAAGGKTAVATATSSGGSAAAVSVAAGPANSTATALSNATSSGNGTALSVGIADATAGGSGSVATANSSAHADGGQTAVSIVNATLPASGPGPANITAKCVLVGASVNSTGRWSCRGEDAAAPQPVAPAPGAAEPQPPATEPQPAAAEPEPAAAEPGTPLVPEGSSPASAPAFNALAPTWLSAPACAAAPDASNSVADTTGRLWGYESGASCAFRAEDGGARTYPGFEPAAFDAAPACADEPSSANSMSDDEGRLWGWTAAGDNCAFKDERGQPLYYPQYFAPGGSADTGGDGGVALAEAAPVAPAAAGPPAGGDAAVRAAESDGMGAGSEAPKAAEPGPSGDGRAAAALKLLAKIQLSKQQAKPAK